MIERVQIKLLLESMSIFSEFTGPELETFIDLSEPVSCEPEEMVVRQDEPGNAMFIVLTGEVRVDHRSEGKTLELAKLGPGAFFGELSLVDDGPRSADVIAVSGCELLKVSQPTYRALAGVHPAAAFKLLIAIGRVVVARFRSQNQRYIDSLLALKGGA